MKRINIKKHAVHMDFYVGAITCRIISTDSAWVAFLRKKFAPFLCTSLRPSIRIQLDVQRGRHIVATHHFDVMRGTAHILVPYHRYAFRAFNSNLKIVCSAVLLCNRGIIFHASSILKKGEAYIFVGLSGSGKSTIVRLSPDGSLLGDDSSIVQKSGHTYVVYGSPFYEKNFVRKRSIRAKIKGIFILHKSSRNAIIEAEDPSKAFGYVWLYFSKSMDRETVILLKKELWKRSIDMKRSVPVYDVFFKKDPFIWKLLDQVS